MYAFAATEQRVPERPFETLEFAVKPRFSLGDWVIYRKQKRSARPGPRAQIVGVAEKGDSYAYLVDKYWVVVQVTPGRVTVRTRKGKLHEIEMEDPRLRRANWWERWWLRERFRELNGRPLASDDLTPRDPQPE